MEKAGYRVETASNAVDFKAAYESLRPTVIVLDLLIPNEDGIELLWYLHRKDYDGAIIVVSGATKTMHIAAQTMAKGLGLCIARNFGNSSGNYFLGSPEACGIALETFLDAPKKFQIFLFFSRTSTYFKLGRHRKKIANFKQKIDFSAARQAS